MQTAHASTSTSGPLDDPLWARIARHPIGHSADPGAFTRRLARENMWRIAHAEAVVQEYRRFCYLACVAPGEITPSDAVDQAWHLHLCHTRDYWDRFCGEVLGRPLHHGPSDGTAGDAARFARQYAETLALYAARFGQPPPATIWPDAEARFRSGHGIRIDGHHYLLVRKTSLPGRLLRMFARPGR